MQIKTALIIGAIIIAIATIVLLVVGTIWIALDSRDYVHNFRYDATPCSEFPDISEAERIANYTYENSSNEWTGVDYLERCQGKAGVIVYAGAPLVALDKIGEKYKGSPYRIVNV